MVSSWPSLYTTVGDEKGRERKRRGAEKLGKLVREKLKEAGKLPRSRAMYVHHVGIRNNIKNSPDCISTAEGGEKIVPKQVARTTEQGISFHCGEEKRII